MHAEEDQGHSEEGRSAPPARVPCWRCGTAVDASDERCPLCAAAIASPSAAGRVLPSPAESSPAVRLIGVFAILMLVSVVQGVAVRPQTLFVPPGGERPLREVLAWTTVAEAVDTALVLAALAMITVRHPPGRLKLGPRVAVWLGFGVPVLAVLLAIDFGYHAWLRELVRMPLIESRIGEEAGLLPWWFVLICIQPALIEELFFRHLALGVLRSMMAGHAAVFISAVMFAMAHVGVPLSMPYLFLVGIALGYARIAGGGLGLPITMHFLHNAVVLVVESGCFTLS